MFKSRTILQPFTLGLTVAILVALSVSNMWGMNLQQGVAVVTKETERRVDILIDGKLFTSYLFPTTIKKPILYPLRTAKGTVVTRGFPLEKRPGERVDHPHQVGTWFNYGNVNGIDFWGHSYATPAENAPKMGTIVHREIKRAVSGKDRGELEVAADWVLHDGSTILRENTRFIFHGASDLRAVDRITTWTALDKQVRFSDTKEGAFGIRVARALEQPSKEPEVFTDARGEATKVPKLDNSGVNGLYRSSEGKTGDDVWGKRARWMILTGTVENEQVTLGILDHPKNVGHPTYWHARGYGLLAANPFGWKDFTSGRETLNFTLEPKQSVTFRHRILIASGTLSPERVEAQYQGFLKDVQ